jgi:DNA-binding transcriptional MerR regulator
MQIGIAAKKVGLSVDAIRFYERNALIPRPPRTQGGFRQYGQSDIDRACDSNLAKFEDS